MTNSLKKILVIEDEEPVRKVIVDALQDLNCEVLEAKNGQEGLDIALSEHPDLILLDLIMPKLAGQEVCEKLRSDTWGKNVHVIILTNLDSKTEKEELKDLSVDDYLVKSNYKLEEIMEKVNNLL
ncbi:response regulator [Patescibacteria group bacterium]|nr:response regulator [Patescibacteria group bacterium]